jgi:hypothetical protein
MTPVFILYSQANQKAFFNSLQGVARLFCIADDIELRDQILEGGKRVFRF